ncbi:MAG: PfkB family carbohydrate kinase, partial [bacterium]|nr:PfkB family carbohydrate kinase [bacterium]
MSILVVGSVAFDSVKTPFGQVERILGGSAVHFSMAASILSQVHLVGVVGEDFGEENILTLKRRGINVDNLNQIKGGKTFFWQGYYEYDMNQAHTVKTELNVFQNFNPVIPDNLKNSEYVFLANIDPDIQLALIQQVRNPKLIVCDTMNYWIENKKEALLNVMKKVDVMLLNDGEARELFNTTNLIKAAKKAMALGVKVVIIKKGEHGAIMFSQDSIFTAPAFPLEEVIDPTGAGDSFAGGFLSFLERNKKINDEYLRKALVYSTIIASFYVQDFGTRAIEKITYTDIKQRYVTLQKITQFKNI